jgi:outer membrane lipoprotein-sorting protein
VELIPKQDAAVTWGKVLYWIDKNNLLPVKVEFYDEEDLLVTVLEYFDVKQFNDRKLPTKWVMIPQDEEKKGHSTTIMVKSMSFNEPIDESIFSLSALKKLSR